MIRIAPSLASMLAVIALGCIAKERFDSAGWHIMRVILFYVYIIKRSGVSVNSLDVF